MAKKTDPVEQPEEPQAAAEENPARPVFEAPGTVYEGRPQAAWAGQPPPAPAEASARAAAEAPRDEERELAQADVYGNKDKKAPWFQGAQAAWAGEAPPPGIRLTLALANPAEEGSKSIDLTEDPGGLYAGQLQPGAFATLIRADSSPSEPYVVGPGYQTGDLHVPLVPRVRDRDEGARSLKTAGEPVPGIALGQRDPAIWDGPVLRLDDEPDPIHRVTSASIPGSHSRLGWANASLAIGGVGGGS
jgi:hypothetical protein